MYDISVVVYDLNALIHDLYALPDDNECQLGTHNCGQAYECRNTPGSFRCVTKNCPDGYKLDYSNGQCKKVVCPRGMKADRSGNCIGEFISD